MNPRAWALFVTVAVAATSARAQGTFQNLDFEAARLIPIDNDHPWFIATSNALPGWTATYGGSQLAEVPYAGGLVVGVGLVGPSPYAIDGSFSAGLVGGSITQTGLIPEIARSLRFKVDPNPMVLFYPTNVVVSLGGKRLSLVLLGAQQGYFGEGADISSFAGQTETLSFSGGSFALDDIAFSPQIVPEPGGVPLLLMGLGVLTHVRRRLHGGDRRPLERRWPPQEFVRWEG